MLCKNSEKLIHVFLTLPLKYKWEETVTKSVNPLKPEVWKMFAIPRGGAQRPPYKIIEGGFRTPSCYLEIGRL